MKPRISDSNRPAALILKAGVLNAALVTVISALVIALVSGAGREGQTIGPGVMSKHGWIGSTLPNPWELLKAVLLLCPITAVSCGSFGLLAGFVGAGFMYYRGGRISSPRRFLIEASIAGFLLALLFLPYDLWMSRVQGFRYYYGPSLLVLSPVLGVPCGLICAVVFRRRFLRSTQAVTGELGSAD